MTLARLTNAGACSSLTISPMSAKRCACLLKGEGFDIDAVPSPAALLTSLETREFDAVLMDLNYARDTTSGQEGLDLLTRNSQASTAACR